MCLYQDCKSKVIILFFIAFLINSRVLAQGAVFLMIYPGARSVGMAGAFTAVADDGSAAYYNPAGIAFQKDVNLYLCRSNWLPGLYPGMRYSFGTLTIPFRWADIGIAVTYLNTGKTEVINDQGQYIGEFETYDVAPAIYASKKISSFLAVGGTLKYIYSFLVPDWVFDSFPELNMTGGTGKSVALDLGMLSYFNSFGKTGVGLVMQNLGPGISYTSSGAKDPLPLAIKFGLSHKITLNDMIENESDNWFINWLFRSSRLIIAFDFYRSLVGSNDFWQSYGLELQISPFAIRLGKFNDPEGARVGRTTGFGLDLNYLKFNVANDANIYDFSTENLRYDLTISFPFNY
jgi:hypothetical protein